MEIEKTFDWNGLYLWTMSFLNSNRLKQLAGLLKEQIEVGDERHYKYNTVDEWLADYAMGVSFHPDEVAPGVRAFAKKYNFDIPKMIAAAKGGEITEQKFGDESPESLWPSREDEEDLRAAQQLETERNEDEEQFGERLPPGFEDDGFNATIINDIGFELGEVKASVEGVKKAEMLLKRLGQAIEALKKEINSQVE